MLRHFVGKHKTNHTHTDARTFAILELLKSFSLGAFITIFPIILYNKIGTEDYIGYYNSVIALIGLITCILSSYIFCKYSKAMVTKITLAASCFILIFMTLANNIWSLMFLDIPRAIFLAIAAIAISLYLGDYSKDEDLAVNEARYYLYSNIGWFLGPITSGVLVHYYGFESMFILCSVSLGIALLYFLHQHLVANHPDIADDDVHDEQLSELFSHIVEYFKDKERFKVFLVAAGLNLSWTSAVYVIIALKIMGYGMITIGVIAACRCIPLILLEPWVGKQASKNGVKKYIVFGFLLNSIMLTSLAFIENHIILLIMFTIANLGMAFVEPLQETYLFKVVKSERKRAKFFGIYNTADPIVYLIAPIIASVILTLTIGFNALWIFYGIMMLIFAGIATTIKE